MPHFAQLSEHEVKPGVRDVIHVSAVANDKILDSNGQESEALGIARQKRIHGSSTFWKQCAYNANGDPAKWFNFPGAGNGWRYDANRLAFIPPKPYASWVLDESVCQWEAPIAKPATTGIEVATWNETQGAWDVTALISKNEFDDRFTQDEWNAIDDSVIPEVKRLKAKAFWLTNDFIDLKDPRVIDGLNALEFVFKRADGVTPILPTGRAAQILSVA